MWLLALKRKQTNSKPILEQYSVSKLTSYLVFPLSTLATTVTLPPTTRFYKPRSGDDIVNKM